MAKTKAEITFTADTSEFSEGIKKANSSMTELRSELKLVNAQMANSGTSVDGLEQKERILSEMQEQMAAKVDALNGKYLKAVEIWGKNSIEAQKYATQLNSAKTAQEKLKGDISRCNAELQEARSKMDKAETAARGLADGLDDAAREAKGLDTSIGNIAAGNMIADFATEGIQALAGLEEATRQYRNEQNKLEAIAQSSDQSLDDLKGSYSDLYAITADETLSSTAVANMSAMGLSTEQTSTLVHAATGIWAQYGDSIPLDGLMESINETSAVGTVTGNLADALNWASISEDEFNEKLAACSTEQERQQLIIDTLNGAYSGLADSYIENNAAVMAVNESNEKMMDSQSRLAEKIAPLQATITSLAADGIGFLADNLNIIAPIATAAAVAIGILAVAMNFSAITAAATGAISAMSAALTALSANPVVLVVAGLILIVTTIVTLWNNCEEFRQFWLDLWDGCVASFQKAGEFFSSIGASIRSTVTNISTTVSSVFSNIYNAITSKIAAARDFVGNAISAIKGFFNFSWSLPQIKLPHFSVSGGQAPWGFMGQGSLPKVSVSWYAKAMNTAMVLDGATIFGYGNGSLLGAGESGREVVSGESHLIGLIGNAVQKAVSNVSNHNEVNVTVHAQGDPDEIARAVAYKVFDAIDEANTRNGR